MSTYHHGQTIKEYRKLKGWTQAQLAAAWPKVDGEAGVNVRYVQDVEYGEKRIHDPSILRKLSEILEIPLWMFGLSEYNPFDPNALPGHGKHMYRETLNVTGALIQQTLAIAMLLKSCQNKSKLDIALIGFTGQSLFYRHLRNVAL